MKVWIVEYKGEIVGASTDEVEACRGALIAGGFSQDSIDNAVLDGCIEAAESIGATVRLVDIAALERVAEAAREMVAAERGVAESFRADPRSGGIGAAGWKAAKNAVRDAIDALDVPQDEEEGES